MEFEQDAAVFAEIGRTCNIEVFEAFSSMDILVEQLASGISCSKNDSQVIRFIKHVTGNTALREDGFLRVLLKRVAIVGNTRILDALLSPSLKSRLHVDDPHAPLLLAVKFNECTATFDPLWALYHAANHGSVEGFLNTLNFFEEKGMQFDYSSSKMTNLFFRMQSIDVLKALEKRVTDPAKLNAMFDKAAIYDSSRPLVPRNTNHFQFHIYPARRFAEKMKKLGRGL